MNVYRVSGVRAKTSPATGPESFQADFCALHVADAWHQVGDMTPCDGEWSCQLWLITAAGQRRLKSRTVIKVTLTALDGCFQE